MLAAKPAAPHLATGVDALPEFRDMYRIEVAGIECQARLGVPDKERKQPQRILVDVSFVMDLSEAVAHDDFHRTVDYEMVVDIVQSVVDERPWSLVESLATAIGRRVLSRTGADETRVRVVKFPLALQGRVHHVAAAVTLTRQTDPP